MSQSLQSPTDFMLLLLSYSDMIKIANFSDLVPYEHPVDSTNGQPPSSTFPNQFLLVEGVSTGVSHIPNANQNPVSYNIGMRYLRRFIFTYTLTIYPHMAMPTTVLLVLEKVYLGGIPYQAGKLAVAIIASLLVGIFVVVPWVEQVIRWVVEENGFEILNSRYLKRE